MLEPTPDCTICNNKCLRGECDVVCCYCGASEMQYNYASIHKLNDEEFHLCICDKCIIHHNISHISCSARSYRAH